MSALGGIGGAIFLILLIIVISAGFGIRWEIAAWLILLSFFGSGIWLIYREKGPEAARNLFLLLLGGVVLAVICTILGIFP